MASITPGSSAQTIGDVINRAKEIANSPEALTDEQIIDIEKYFEVRTLLSERARLEDEYREWKASRQVSLQTPSIKEAIPASPIAVEQTSEPSDAQSVKTDIPVDSSNTSSDEQEDTRTKQLLEFVELPDYVDLQNNEKGTNDGIVKEVDDNSSTKPSTAHVSPPTISSRISNGFWNTVSRFYPTKQ